MSHIKLGDRVKYKDRSWVGEVVEIHESKGATVRWDHMELIRKYTVPFENLSVVVDLATEDDKCRDLALKLPRWMNKAEFSDYQLRQLESVPDTFHKFSGPSDEAESLLLTHKLDPIQRASVTKPLVNR